MAYRIHEGDARKVLADLPSESADCIVTSPPYFGVRDYGHPEQYGLEPTVEQYVATLTRAFTEAKRVLKTSGTFWLNVADVYGGGGIARRTGKWPGTHNPDDRTNGRRRSYEHEKCLLGVPDKLAAALVGDGWVLRNKIIWVKQRPVPSNGVDRLDSQHETVFLFVKRDGRRPNYYFNKDARAERGDVWTIPVSKEETRHFATYPVALAERCIDYGCPPGGTVLDPFCGSATSGVAALLRGSDFVGVELKTEYVRNGIARLDAILPFPSTAQVTT